ncbi:other/NAK protein kinase [Calocera viscosa TUFC12733]|uniref:non-specific serine/threonine protein kinase n=1 Tax=Calocera viscosa (strain TUFC12733) TaxID=1330018 RepID=A0A167R2X7_CALVF|nr:other/NAK protein kinase [Calocera viscosa TUFC12733]
MSSLLWSLQSLQEKAKDAIYALSSCICREQASLKINGRTFKLLKVLGEGGFSFVYLAQDETSGRMFALKKIRCPTGAEGVREAMREVEAYRRFRHPNIIRILDSAVVQDRDGDGQIVYLFLPYYKRGNLQDQINSNTINGTRFSELEMCKLFRGTCLAVRAMHDYRPSKETVPPAAPPAGPSTQVLPRPQGEQEEEERDEHEGQGFAYDARDSVPLMIKRTVDDEDVVFDGDQELRNEENENENENANGGPAENGDAQEGQGAIVPYAHRDIKPGNVMVADDGTTPILMDFGSTIRARIPIKTRQQALVQQDLAAEQSTMPYRAPELFDVKTNHTLTESVDVWSLGCTLFALAYNHSPFETNATTEQGGSMAMAVMGGVYKHPLGYQYSQGFRNLIDAMLKVNPEERPDIHQVIEMTDKVIASLSA